MDELEIRQLENDQLQWLLGRKRTELNVWSLLIACDELLKRKIAITALPGSFESLVRGLTSKQLKYIDEYESSFELATVFAVNLEMRSRGIPALVWYAETVEGRIGPCDRRALQECLNNGDLDRNALVWREGMKAWTPIMSFSGFDRLYFFKQDIPQLPGSTIAKSTQPTDSSKLAGVLQFVSFPFWLCMIIIAPINGAGSSIGWSMPLLLSVIMSAISIPLGIGLYKGSEWAIRVKSVAAMLTSAWFFSWYFVDEMSRFWLFAASVELILLTFVLVSPRIKMI